MIPFWYQLGSILELKIDKISFINQPQEAKKKRSIFASIFYRFLIDLGCQLGAMLAAFSAQEGQGNEVPPSFLLRCFFRYGAPRDRWGTSFLAPKSDGVPHFWSSCETEAGSRKLGAGSWEPEAGSRKLELVPGSWQRELEAGVKNEKLEARS